MIAFDVTYLNQIENIFLQNVTVGFDILSGYARHLLYYFILFEIVFAGFAWALYQSQLAERLFFQLLKVGLVLFVVENYASILNGILNSFMMIGDQMSQQQLEKILLNPAYLWQYGYNFAIDLLKIAASSDGFAMPLILMTLGFGILLVVGIFGIQIFLQVVGFYLVSAVSLLMIPLSAFSPLRDFFSQSVKTLLQAGIRLLVQMMIVGGAILAWPSFNGQHFTREMNINAPLGFLFTGLLFVLASAYLPRIAAKVVGSIHWSEAPLVSHQASPPVALSTTTATTMVNTTQQAATFLPAATTAVTQTATAATIPTSTNNASIVTQAVREQLAKSTMPSAALKGLSKQYQRELERLQNKNVALLKTAFQEVLHEMRGEKH